MELQQQVGLPRKANALIARMPVYVIDANMGRTYRAERFESIRGLVWFTDSAGFRRILSAHATVVAQES